MADVKDEKPNIPDADTITIRVKEVGASFVVQRVLSSVQDGAETFFKVKPTTKMSKVFDAYAKRKGVASGTLRFLFDGERVQPDDTPAKVSNSYPSHRHA